jgi:2-dehydropantoate 2-reductase
VRYILLGCGAIGGTVAAGLVRDGHEVLVSDADPAVVAAINARGLRIEGPVENFTVPLRAVMPGGLPTEVDCPVLVAVKAHHTAAAAAALAGRLRDGACVVSLQNGLNAGILASAVGEAQVVGAFVNFGADVLEPGVVLRGNRATFMIGELDGSITSRVRSLTADIADAEVTGNILGYLWAKQAYGAMLAATAVSGLPIADVLDDPGYAPLLSELARQVLAQAPVPPMPFDGFDPADLAGSLRRLARFNRESARTHSGIYRDLAVRRRPTEVPAILSGLDGPMVHRVVELIQAIEQGRRPCARENLDLLAAYERLERLGRPVNAVASMATVPERAAGGPLAGRLVAVKDIIAVAGLPTGCGSPASDPAPATGDAAVVHRLRAAGAEVFATTQCLEYAAGFAHPEIGDTRNPWDPSRTSGGSSGGSAAVVAAGVCELALGTDTGGSVRIPAAYCGVVGLKPSYGVLPLEGVFPLSPSCDHVGTLTATVSGAADLLAALADLAEMAGPAATASLTGTVAPSQPTRAGEDAPVFTVGVLAAQLADPSVTPAVHAAVSGALATLGAAGWQVRQVAAPWLDELAEWEEVLAVIVAREASLVHRGRSTSRYAEGTRALLASGASVGDECYTRALARRAELTAAVDASLAGVDVLAGPTVGYQAPEQDPPFGVGDDYGEGRFTGPYNLTGHPAVSLPVPAAGLPAGLQLAGRRGGDLALLRVAAAAEQLIARAALPALPDLTERPHDVTADDGADVSVGVIVLDEPSDDVVEVLGRALQVGDVGDALERGPGGGALGEPEKLGEDAVQADVVAVERVGPEGHVLDADDVDAVGEVVHHQLDAVRRMLPRDRGVRRGRHAGHATGRGDGAEQVVGLYPGGVPDGLRAGVRDEHRFLADLAHVEPCPVRRARDVDRHAKPVHPLDRTPAERCQAAVVRLAQSGTECVRVRVRDPHLPDAEPVEDVEPVELVLDGRGGFESEHQRQAPGLMGVEDVVECAGDGDEVLVGDVGLPHPEVRDDVVPFPWRVAGDAGRAVHQVVEYCRHAGTWRAPRTRCAGAPSCCRRGSPRRASGTAPDGHGG